MKISDEFERVIEESGLFDRVWYLEKYGDVASLGIEPLAHFVRFGLMMDRDPGPLFDTRFYKAKNPDVVNAGMIPLEHYIHCGIREGRVGVPQPGDAWMSETARDWKEQPHVGRVPASLFSGDEATRIIEQALARTLEGKPRRLFDTFDMEEQERIVTSAALIYLSDRERFEAITVSIVMPTFNRADRIRDAVRSVQAQSHANFELLIVDDGSDDDTRDVLGEFADDPRVRVFWNDHLGVSAARNTGLRNATGRYVFYLDSDNSWTPDFLSVMCVAFEISDHPCLYGASKLHNARNELVGYRGEPFDWDECLAGNYIDMNVFGHRLDLVDTYGSFDTTLERMVDWDLILRYTREEGAAYCPVIGCIYFDDHDDRSRITTSKPYIFRKIVHEKNRKRLATTAETFAGLSLSICIKIPVSYKDRHAWGDFHYAESLKTSLEGMGHAARIDFLEDWENPPSGIMDVTVVLRGLSYYKPKPNEFSVLWNISHPDQVSYEEYASYDMICMASSSYAELLSAILCREVKPLLQCVDSGRFAFREYENNPDKPGVFVGNSRNEYREIVRWSVDVGVDLDVYGQRWEQFLPRTMIKKENVPNTELADLYAEGRFVLNDHWASMKDFGIVSNRVFDVVGCGGRLVSDNIASINDLCDGVVEIVDSASSLSTALSNPLPSVARTRRWSAANKIHTHHSFDARARELVAHISDTLLGTTTAPATVAPSAIRRKRVALLVQQGYAWPTSSAFIRLIAPLTTDYACRVLQIVQVDSVNDPRLRECDICIVQRIAVREKDDAAVLVRQLEKFGIPLYVDTDDAFFFHEQHEADDEVLQNLMRAARETWFSTLHLKKLYDHVPGTKRVVKNTLDPRFWRNYRRPVPTAFDSAVVRFLYMGTATHDDDFQVVLPWLRKLAEARPGSFELTIVGAVRNPPAEPWIEVLSPPADKGSYPLFVRWLMANNRFDVGIAPLTNSEFNDAKSDVKILDYGAMGLLPLVSDRPAYRMAIENGLAIGCRDDDWFDRMIEIIEDPQSFEAQRAMVQEHVWSTRNTLQGSETLVDLLMARYRH